MREYNDLIDRMRSHPALGAMQKTVLTAQGLLEDSFRLGVKVLDSGFRPTMIIAIWRGGTTVGMAVQDLLA